MMKRNSIIEMYREYVSPTVIVMSFESEGILCQSQTGAGGGGYEPDPDNPEIDF